MSRLCGTKSEQRGAALILFATVLILGVAWYAVGALGKAPVATAEREAKTGLALQSAKQALLAHIARQAADTTERSPGRFPCPEHPSVAGTANAGIAAPIVGVASTSPCSGIGRLPWRTLGVDQILDGYNEPLWLIVPTGTWALSISTTTLVINPGVAGQLRVDGVANAAVALIVAPGAPLNTLSDPGAPSAGCVKADQNAAGRNTAPLNPANFLECADSAVTVPGSYATVPPSPWSNDRVITITALEVMQAIAGPVADRMQRQVAPAMEAFRSTTSLTSWGQRYLPNASTFGNPATNDYCGDLNTREGLPPTATVAAGTCSTNWSGGSLFGLGLLLSFGACTPSGTDLRCSFTMLLPGIATPGFNLTAPRIGYSFRSFDPADLRIEVNGGAPQNANVINYSAGGVSSADGSSDISFQLQFPLLALAANVVVIIPNPSDALLADTRSAWYINNRWDRYSYYGVARPATSDPAGTCTSVTFTDCLTVSGMPAPANNKRLVLVLMGPNGVPGQAWSGATPAGYFEAENATALDREYETQVVSSTFNDRVVACPFSRAAASGTVTICN